MSAAAPFLDLDVATAAAQWRGLLDRGWKPKGKRQVNFVPVEVLTALALLLVVDPSTQGWGTFDPLVEKLRTWSSARRARSSRRNATSPVPDPTQRLANARSSLP